MTKKESTTGAVAPQQKTVRKSITKKTRFEVFKRDSFICQYCGASAPQVVLNVDHIEPVSKGGSDKLTNLITACFGCNSGKSDRTLSDKSIVEKQKMQVDELQERRNQLEMMMSWHKGVCSVEEDAAVMAADYFNKKLDEKKKAINEVGVKSLRKILRKHSFKDLLSAIDIAYDQYIESSDDEDLTDSIELAFRKLEGICKNKDASENDMKIHYIKGILRNRLTYFSERDYYIRIKDYMHFDMDAVSDLAKSASSWSEFWYSLAQPGDPDE